MAVSVRFRISIAKIFTIDVKLTKNGILAVWKRVKHFYRTRISSAMRFIFTRMWELSSNICRRVVPQRGTWYKDPLLRRLGNRMSTWKPSGFKLRTSCFGSSRSNHHTAPTLRQSDNLSSHLLHISKEGTLTEVTTLHATWTCLGLVGTMVKKDPKEILTLFCRPLFNAHICWSIVPLPV